MQKSSNTQSLKNYSQCLHNVLVSYPLLLIIIFFCYSFAIASGNFVRISLPKGLELDFPQNWIVLSNNQRITLDSSVESRLDLSDLPNPDSQLPFAANCYNDAGETIGITNVRYYPNIDLSQADARQATSQDVYELDAALKEIIIKSMKAFGMSILSWNGTKKVDINGLTAFITEYRRNALKKSGAFRVRLVRVLDSERSFTLTVSYLESVAVYLEPITDRIIKSIKLSGYNVSRQSSKKESEPASTQSIMSELYGGNWVLTLIISAILTWGIGLAPPLLIRFAILRRPIISKASVVGIVVLFWFINIIIFTALGSTSKTHAGLFLVALVSYAILRKGSPWAQ